MSEGVVVNIGESDRGSAMVPSSVEAFEPLVPLLVAADGELGAVMDKVVPKRRSDAVTYFNRQVRRLRAGKLSDLPAWDTVLNDLGQPLCSTSSRPARLAVLSMSSDPDKRCFVVQGTSDFSRSDASNLVVKAAQGGFRVAGTIQVSDDLMVLLWSTWDGKRGVAAGGVGDVTAVQKLFDEVASAAVLARASDVHIAWDEGTTSLYFRVDGRVRHYMDMTEELGRAMVSAAYNTMADQDSTAEGWNDRALQDGVISRTLHGRSVRLRYAGAPITGGYDVTLRVIDVSADKQIKTLGELGYTKDQQKQLDRAVSKPSGMVVFLGSTGSGKTTSLGSLLTAMVDSDPFRIYRTVEEPVEVKIRGVRQTDVPRQKGKPSALNDVLRSILRKDPDVIMVGEIRDALTAELAIGAVRSGHLALTTLHTEGALLFFDRLATLGLKRLDLATQGLWNALVFQRLVPVLCTHCKVPADGPSGVASKHPELAERLAAIDAQLSAIYLQSQDGCPRCDSGIAGRTVCAEIIVPTQRFLNAMVAQDFGQMCKEWRSTIKPDDPACMTGRTAFEQALWKMRQGEISPVDVERFFDLVDEPVFDGVDR